MLPESKEVIEMVDFMVAFGNGLDKSLEDNKLSILDAPNFYPAIMKAGDAFKDFNLKDLGHLSAEAKAEVIAHVAASLTLNSERTEEIIVEALATAVQLGKLVNAIKK